MCACKWYTFYETLHDEDQRRDRCRHSAATKHHIILREYVLYRSRRWQHTFNSMGWTHSRTRPRIPTQTATMTHTRNMPHSRIVHIHKNTLVSSYQHMHAAKPTDGIIRVYLNKIALRSEQFTFSVQTVHTEIFIFSCTLLPFLDTSFSYKFQKLYNLVVLRYSRTSGEI